MQYAIPRPLADGLAMAALACFCGCQSPAQPELVPVHVPTRAPAPEEPALVMLSPLPERCPVTDPAARPRRAAKTEREPQTRDASHKAFLAAMKEAAKLRRQGRARAALRAFERAMQLGPNEPAPALAAARLIVDTRRLWKKEGLAKAMRYARQASELEPSRPMPYLYHGAAAQMTGDHDSALRSYRDFVARAPSNRLSLDAAKVAERLRRLAQGTEPTPATAVSLAAQPLSIPAAPPPRSNALLVARSTSPQRAGR